MDNGTGISFGRGTVADRSPGAPFVDEIAPPGWGLRLPPQAVLSVPGRVAPLAERSSGLVHHGGKLCVEVFERPGRVVQHANHGLALVVEEEEANISSQVSPVLGSSTISSSSVPLVSRSFIIIFKVKESKLNSMLVLVVPARDVSGGVSFGRAIWGSMWRGVRWPSFYRQSMQ